MFDYIYSILSFFILVIVIIVVFRLFRNWNHNGKKLSDTRHGQIIDKRTATTDKKESNLKNGDLLIDFRFDNAETVILKLTPTQFSNYTIGSKGYMTMQDGIAVKFIADSKTVK